MAECSNHFFVHGELGRGGFYRLWLKSLTEPLCEGEMHSLSLRSCRVVFCLIYVTTEYLLEGRKRWQLQLAW